MTVDTTPKKPKDPVLIIGAGITGLLLAQGLKKDGIPYRIFEKEISLDYRSAQWTMAIHWSLEHLETIIPSTLWAKLADISCNPAVPIDAGGNYPIIHGESGNLLAGVPYKRGLRVPRSKMRALCAEGIDVEYGKALEDVAFFEGGDGVVASFKDGSTVRGFIIAGTDGPRSKVREFGMHGAEKASNTPFPVWHHNMTVCYNDAEKAKFIRHRFPTSYLALSDRSFHAFQSISSMPDGPDHPETWIFHLAMAWLGESDHSKSYTDKLALIKERAKGMEEPARSAFQWIPEDTPVHRADISYWISQSYDNFKGRLVMLGDAAHPMPPYRGQGLNHCICDTRKFLDVLSSAVNEGRALEDIIPPYADEVTKRGAEEVACSVENGMMLHDWDKVLQSPVFKTGFKPMDGHNKPRENNVSEHARLHSSRNVQASAA